MKSTYIFWMFVCIYVSGVVYGNVRYHSVGPITEERIRNIQLKCNTKIAIQRSLCFRREFKKIVRPNNLKEIIRAIEKDDESVKLTPRSQGMDCHGVEHIVGETAGQLSAASIATLIPACGASCGYGCAHGVVMGAIKSQREYVDHLETVCQAPSTQSLSVADEIACYHGIGHGLAEYTGYNLVQATERCASLATQDWQDECLTGVYMEIYSPADSSHVPEPLPNDLFAHCNGLNESSQEFCKRMMIAAQYRKTRDILSVIQICRNQFGANIDKCIFSVGADVYFIEQKNVQRIINTCNLVGSYRLECIYGAVMSSITIHQNDLQAIDICTASPPTDVPACLNYVRERMQKMGVSAK